MSTPGGANRPVATLASFRLGGADGVAVEAAKWGRALGSLGYEVRTVAGSGQADLIVPELRAGSLESAGGPDPSVWPDPSIPVVPSELPDEHLVGRLRSVFD
ncbi:MAG: hypothetical protein ACRD0H_13030, partial [Actinomycetes bacterium]